MTGLPAARQTDMTKHGGPITQGSRTVYIGTSGGVACSTCPGGVSVGNPVNPMLGAKVQSGEVDLALPGPLPFVVSRDYSSYQTDTPAPVGLLGPGWWLPTEVTLLQTQDLLTLNDSKGRSIRFAPLAPGQAAYSRSENLWIVRGGLDRLDLNKELPVSRLNLAWMGLHEDDRRNPSLFFVTNNLLGPWWVLGTTAPADQVTGKRLQLFGINDRFGRSLRLKRNAEGHVVAVQDGVGRQYRLELKTLAGLATEALGGWGADCGVRLMAVYLTHDPHEPDLPHHPLVRYEYSPRGELIKVFGRDGGEQRQFQYHPQLLGRMTTNAFAGRSPVNYVYNTDGKVIEQIRVDALSYHFDYSEHSTTVTDSLGRTRVYFFKGSAGLRRLVKLQNADGSCIVNRFDASGRLIASIDPLGRETRFEPDIATSQLISVTLPDGMQSRWDYNLQGQLVESRSPDGASERNEYDHLGRIITRVDPLGYITRFHYTDLSSEAPNIVQDPHGGKQYLAWNSVGLLASFTDCSGSITRYHYDRWGQLIETIGEEGSRNISQYNLKGQLFVRTDAINQNITYAYNQAGDLISIVDAASNSVRFDRNQIGEITTYRYGPYIQKFEYDEAGRLKCIVNENGAKTTFEYDVMDRLVKQINFDGRTQSNRFNMAGERIESNDEGLISHFYHDSGGRLIKRQIDNGECVQEVHFQYANDGLLKKAWHCTEIGKNTIAVEFIRDPLGRIISENQRITDPQGNEVWQYDVERSFNELGIESQTLYKGLPPIEWQTYGSGHLFGMVLDGKSLIDFERDKLHREISRNFGLFQIECSYDALSRLSHQHTHSPLIREGEALKRQYHYDATGQLTRIDTANGPHEYGYDKAGRLISALQPSLALQYYRFDPAGNRLFENQAATTPSVSWEETVRQHIQDKNFNLLGSNGARDIHETEPKWMDNRIKDDGEYYYEYDAWGNLRRKYKTEGNEEHRYYYDNHHRLIRYTLESDTQVWGANYHYDSFGRRVAKQVQEADKDGNLAGAPTTTFFGWDGDRMVMAEDMITKKCVFTIYQPNSFTPIVSIEDQRKAEIRSLSREIQDQTNTKFNASQISHFKKIEKNLRVKKDDLLNSSSIDLLKKFVNIDHELISSREIYYYHCDHLGTPLRKINYKGVSVWSAIIDPWGYVEGESNAPGSSVQSLRFPGQYHDRETGLYYNRHRYYDPKLGGYISQDPIGLQGGLDKYTYPRNPLTSIDPLGLQDFSGFPGMGPGTAQRASLGMYMMQQGASQQEISNALYGPPTGFKGTLSAEGSISGHVIGGGSGAVGVAVGKDREAWLPKLCAYLTTCQTVGPGAAGGVSINGSATNAPPSTGVTYHAGGFGTGGILGDASGSVLMEISKPSNVTVSGGLGIGGGAAGGLMTCQMYSLCTPNN